MLECLDVRVADLGENVRVLDGHGQVGLGYLGVPDVPEEFRVRERIRDEGLWIGCGGLRHAGRPVREVSLNQGVES